MQTSGLSDTGLPGPEIQRDWPARALVPSYEAYRRHQARELLAIIPREGLRELYGAARDDRSGGDAISDPMAVLDAFVTRHLPLPPFHVWCQDVRANPGAHLDEPWMAGTLPDRTAPLTVAVREELLRSESWRAELQIHHTGDGWRGHIAFSRDEGKRSWRTGDVLREADAQALVERFHEFDRVTLEAFLRSILP